MIQSHNTSTDDYSTEETVIGTWIDGKPIYRRIFGPTTNVTDNSNTYQSLSELVSGASTPSDISRLINSVICGSNKVNACNVEYDSGNLRFANNKVAPVGSYIIVEYTKTTD